MDISADGKKLLISTSRPAYTEYPYNKQDIYLMDITTQQLDTLWKDRLYSISCTFSPDGKKLLISGGPSAFGKLGENIGKNQIANQYDTQLYIYDLATKKVDAITRDFNPSVEEMTWHKNGNIYIKTTDADFVRLYCYADGKFTRIECPGDMILRTSFASHADRMMYTASNTDYPPRIYTLNLTDNQAALWADPNEEQYRNIVFGEMKDWDYKYKKGTVIDGRYYLPADFDPAKKYPLIVYYYGGTTPVSRSFGGRWPFNLYTANGYVVYVLQPSGTIGYGQEFSARHKTIGVKSQPTKLSPRPKHLPKPIRLSMLLRLVVWELLTEVLPPNTLPPEPIFSPVLSHMPAFPLSLAIGEADIGVTATVPTLRHTLSPGTVRISMSTKVPFSMPIR